MITPSAQLRRRDRVRTIAAAGVAVLGVVGILSAVSPPLRSRLQLLLELVPFHIARIAATSLVLVSFALLLMARGLRRGQRLAWGGTLILLALSAVLNVTKGLDLEEAVLAGLAAGWLATQSRSFPVLPTKSAVRSAVVVGVGGAVGSVLVGTVLTMALGRSHHPRVGESVRAVAGRLGGTSVLPLPGAGRFVTPMLVATGLGLVCTFLWVLL